MSWSDRVKKSAGEGADSAYGALEAKLSLGVNEVTTILMDRLKESVGTSRVPTVRATVRSNKVGEPKLKIKTQGAKQQPLMGENQN